MVIVTVRVGYMGVVMTRLPLDKSWIKCLTILEMRVGLHGRVRDFLNTFPQDEMSDDVVACRELLNSWQEASDMLPVRNFRSLAVALQAFLKTRQRNKSEILMGSQLRKRKLEDGYTSQHISAQILAGNPIILDEWELRGMNKLPYHCKIAHEANILASYSKNLKVYREDRTLAKQFTYFIQRLQGKDVRLKIDSAEDVPLAVAMGEMSVKTAGVKFPQLKNHETDRIKEMEYMLTNTDNTSKDHRIVMARAMQGVLKNGYAESPHYKSAVNKSFPMFWKYLNEVIGVYK